MPTAFDSHPLLGELANIPRLGLLTDFDGTLSHLVPEPDAAQATPANLQALTCLIEQLPFVAAISGRGVADLHQRLSLPGLHYVGNHGFELWVNGAPQLSKAAAHYRPALAAAAQQLAELSLPGLWLEDKQATLTLHYRNTANPTAAAAEIKPTVEQIAAQHGLTVHQGQMVYELRPPLPINKGSAFTELVRTQKLAAALYLGDDTTDADALQAARQLRAAGDCFAVGVGVQSATTPTAIYASADVLVDGVGGVESLLAWLCQVRMASST